MGLGFSHSNAHWSCSGFNVFRRLVAQSQGHELFSFEGYEYLARREEPPIKTTRKLSELSKDPLYALYNHSDCEGSLSPRQCARIGPALLAVVEAWPTGGLTLHAYSRKVGIEWARDLIACGKKGHTMRFT